ncbi:MAG: hypothetical protein ACKO9B_17295 [Planctomycetota bacterium]
MTGTPDDPDRIRLRRLLATAAAEERNLRDTDSRLFTAASAADVAAAAASDPVIAERVEAFVARFSRFQDILGDKLLPLVLRMSGEEPQPVIGNLDRAERFGWLSSADDWLRVRKLRNRMVHEYVDLAADMVAALAEIHGAVATLCEFLAHVRSYAHARLL